MVDPVRQLADIAKIIIDTSAVLATRGSELLSALIEQLPGGEEPTPLTADASEDTSDGSGMTVLLAWDNAGTGNSVTIDWGVPDAVDDEAPATGTMSYQYQAEGIYTVTVADLEDEARTAQVEVTVPFAGAEMSLAVTEATADATRMSVDAAVTNGTNGAALVNWGDGSAEEPHPGDGRTALHLFTAAGTFTVTATDSDDATRTASTTVAVPFTAARR